MKEVEQILVTVLGPHLPLVMIIGWALLTALLGILFVSLLGRVMSYATSRKATQQFLDPPSGKRSATTPQKQDWQSPDFVEVVQALGPSLSAEERQAPLVQAIARSLPLGPIDYTPLPGNAPGPMAMILGPLRLVVAHKSPRDGLRTGSIYWRDVQSVLAAGNRLMIVMYDTTGTMLMIDDSNLSVQAIEYGMQEILSTFNQRRIS
jgi:hypothetical protein